MSEHDAPPTGGPDRSKLQLTLLTLALFLMVAFQCVQLIRERASLAELRTTQEPTIQEGLKLRKQLDTLASRTAQLAADGDTGASAIIDDFRRQGITLRPPAGSR
jgi:hypothetical protein